MKNEIPWFPSQLSITGHGGSRAAEYLKNHLFDSLLNHPEFFSNTRLAISKTGLIKLHLIYYQYLYFGVLKVDYQCLYVEL